MHAPSSWTDATHSWNWYGQISYPQWCQCISWQCDMGNLLTYHTVLTRLGGMGLYIDPLFSQASCKCSDFCNKRPLKELDSWLNTSVIQLQVLLYHPSTKLLASMGWVEGPFSTLHGSDLKFLEASENARAQPTTNHLTPDTWHNFNFHFSINSIKVLQTVPTHVSTQCKWFLFPPWVLIYQKVQALVFLFTQNPNTS